MTILADSGRAPERPPTTTGRPSARPSLRILHVTPYYADAWAYGGIPRVCTALARAQDALGHQVTVCTTDARDAHGRLLHRGHRSAANEPEQQVFRNASNRIAWRLQFFTPTGMRRYLRRAAGDFDVAHVHGYHHLPSVWAEAASRRADLPWVLQPNGTAPRIEQRQSLKWLFDKTLGRRVLGAAHRVIAVSDTERVQLEMMGVAPGRIRVIPNPVEVDAFSNLPATGTLRKNIGLGRAPIVAYLGRLSPRKRLDVLLEAFACLNDREAEAPHLVLAGADQGVAHELERRAEALGVGNRMHLLGVLADDQRLPLLVDADVVVYATSQEIFGLVPMEALLASTPVIVGDDSGCGEWLSELGGREIGARLVPTAAGDRQVEIAALNEALESVLVDPQLEASRARRGGALVRDRFAPDGVAQQLIDCYEDLVSDRASQGDSGAPSKPRLVR